MNKKVVYAREETVDASDFRRVLIESGLGSIEPVDDLARLKANLAGADLIITARFKGSVSERVCSMKLENISVAE